MFSIQFGTFESSTPGWFDWLSLLMSIVSIIASVFIAKNIYNSEQRQKDLDEDKLNDEHFKFFKKNLLMQIDAYQKQSKHIDNYISNIKKSLQLNFDVQLQIKTLEYFDIVRLLKSMIKQNVNEDNSIEALKIVGYTDQLFDKLSSELFRFHENLKILEANYKPLQYDILRFHNFELFSLYQNDKDFKKEFGDFVIFYNELINDIAIVETESGKKIDIFSTNEPIDKTYIIDKLYLPLVERLKNLRHKHSIFLTMSIKMNSILNIINDIDNLEKTHIETMKSYKSIYDNSINSLNKIF